MHERLEATLTRWQGAPKRKAKPPRLPFPADRIPECCGQRTQYRGKKYSRAKARETWMWTFICQKCGRTFPALPLRTLDTSPAGVRRRPHRHSGEPADHIAARTGFLLCVQVFAGAPWDPAERRGPLDAWPIATPLPTNLAVARSLSSALQSLALGEQPFLKFPVPHARLTTLRTKTSNILGEVPLR